MSLRIFLAAGEASGDALGASLIAGLRGLHPDVRFTGIAGPGMQAAGMASLFPMEDLSVMGLAEILPRYRDLRRRIAQTAQAVLDDPPDALIGIDSPDFNLRVARRVRAANPAQHTVHYVAPSVWAWRPGRAAKMAPSIDQVLALLPFEPPYMEAAGMRCDFVGHPIAADARPTRDDIATVRARLGLTRATPLVLALPGSRRSEVARLAPTFGAALAAFAQSHPGARFVVPTIAAVAGQVREQVAQWPVPAQVLDTGGADSAAEKRAVFAAADLALAASGTVSLELAAADTPMVIAYDVAWLSRQIMTRMVRVDTVTLVNLVSDTRHVPEFIGARCRAELIAPALSEVLADPGPQRAAMAETMRRLGAGGEAPGVRAARAVLGGLGAAVSVPAPDPAPAQHP